MLAVLLDPPSPGPFFDACRASRDLWPAWRCELEEESGMAVEHDDDDGALLVALDEAEAGWLEMLRRRAAAVGEAVVDLPVAEARRQVPALAGEPAALLHLPGEHRVDNPAACAALAQSCRRRGVELIADTVVERVEAGLRGVRLSLAGGGELTGARLVLAAGAWSGGIAGLPPLPVRPVRGQMLRLGGAAWPWRGTVRGPHRYAVRRRRGELLVGATVEEAGFEGGVTAGGLGDLLDFVRRLLPGLEGAPVLTSWSGLRPGTPDTQPLLGPLGELPVIAATGHYRDGILLAPWTAEVVARTVLEGQLPDEAIAFSPQRFAAQAAPSGA
jgi:glycine oxidase